MEKKRNSYLVSRSMKVYLVAAIASMLIQNINTIIDGILMGTFLGTEAFSAVNLCLPVVGAVSSFGMLFYSGGTILTSLAMGAREVKKANKIYTVSIISMFIASIVLAAVTMLGIDGLTGIVCTAEELKQYTKEYLFVYFAGCPLTMTVAAQLSFTDVGGKPKLVTMSSLANVIVNLLGDIIYVGVLGFGIGGAALATISGSVASLMIVIVDGKLHGKIFSFKKTEGEFGAIFKENIKYGVPMISQSFATVIYAYVCSISAQTFCGVNGAFVVSLLTQATSICQGVSGGVSMSFNAIGGMLAGQKDDIGVRFLFKKGIRLSVIFSAALALVLMLLAPGFASMMGASTPELIEYSARSVRMAMLFVVPITIVWSMSSIFVIAKQLSILPVISVSQPILTGIGLWLCGGLIGNDYMWLGYPLSAVVILLLLVFITEINRKKSQVKRCFFSLLPNEEALQSVYDVSVACSKEELIDTLRSCNTFFEKNSIDEKAGMKIRLCIEEMMLNIIEHAERKNNQYLDLKIVINEQDILAIIKDDGKPFDVVHAENMGAGLKLINAMCSQIDYKYTYGQNMTFMTWKVKGKKEEK